MTPAGTSILSRLVTPAGIGILSRLVTPAEAEVQMVKTMALDSSLRRNDGLNRSGSAKTHRPDLKAKSRHDRCNISTELRKSRRVIDFQ